MIPPSSMYYGSTIPAYGSEYSLPYTTPYAAPTYATPYAAPALTATAPTLTMPSSAIPYTSSYPQAVASYASPYTINGATYGSSYVPTAGAVMPSLTRPADAGALVVYQGGYQGGAPYYGYPSSVVPYGASASPFGSYVFKTQQAPASASVSRLGDKTRPRSFPVRPECTKALLIGINYRGQGKATELQGCINDMRCLAQFVEDQGWDRKNIVIMDDEQWGALEPTRKNILRMMDWLMDDCQSGDSLFFAFSGHGKQVTDTTGDEEDGLDEALMAIDGQLIVDDDLFKSMVGRLPEGALLTAITDCCHAGTILDLPYQMRAGCRAKTPGEGVPALQTGMAICFSGCQDAEESADVDDTAGFSGGACTNAILSALSALGPDCSFAQLLSEMTAAMEERGLSQVPVISASHLVKPNDPFALSTTQDVLRPLPSLRDPTSLNPYIDYIELDQYALEHPPMDGGRTRGLGQKLTNMFGRLARPLQRRGRKGAHRMGQAAHHAGQGGHGGGHGRKHH